MGRSPCCAKEGLNRGAWTANEDKILTEYIRIHGEGRWGNLSKRAGLKRCGKSCRLRWLNYLRPDIKRGNISPDEEELIIRLHKLLGNRWSLIAGRLPGRTDNEIKNHWNTNLSRRFKDHHHRTITSSRRLFEQKPVEKHTENNPRNQAITLSNKSPPSPSPSPKLIRTKTTRAANVFKNPNLHSTMKLQQKDSRSEEEQQQVSPEPLSVASATNNSTANNNQLDMIHMNNFHNVFSSDLLIDFNDIGEICLSDLLNADFSGVCDFSYSNNNSDVDLPPCSEQSLIFSDDMLQDWMQNNFDESNAGSNDVRCFTSFLESQEELLAE